MKNKVIYTLTILIQMVMLLPTVTYAILFDTETSTGNTFTAATLDAQISPPEQLVLDIANTSQRTIQFSLQNIGQLQTNNNIYIESVSNFSFSDLITAELKLNGAIEYTGTLTNLNISDYLDQNINQTDNILITLMISPENLTATTGQTLEFTIVNKSYQLDGNPNSGFFDKESKKIKIINSTN